MAKVVKNSDKKTRGGSKKGERRGGRQKGTPNKRTAEFVEALGTCNPLESLIEIINTTDNEGLKASICLTLLKYLYPQRKAVEISTEKNEPPTINIHGVKI